MKALSLILCSFLGLIQAPGQEKHSASGSGAASPAQRLVDVLTRYEQHSLRDTAYLNAVDSILDADDPIVHLLYNDDSLEQRLNTYQKIAFSDTAYGKYRVRYYRYLLSAADNRNRSGSSIYYSEKNNEESVRMGYFEKDELPHSELFAIAVYLGNKDYARVFARYNALRPLLLAMPESIVAGRKTASPDGVSMVFAVLDIMCYAAVKTGDTAKLHEAILLCERMLDEAGKQPEKYAAYRVYYNFIYHTIGFLRENYLKHDSRARELLEIALREVRDKGFGEANDPRGYMADRYEDAFDFYFDQGQADSARRYLDLIRQSVPDDPEFTNDRLSFVLEGGSKLWAREGQYQAAYRDLRRAYGMRDSALYAAKSDRDNNLYALAAAENAGNELVRTEAMKLRTERSNGFLFLLLTLLLLMGAIGFLLYRFRQEQHLLDLRLGVARNFNGEIGPMLLYTNALLKKEAKNNPSAGLEEMKVQIKHIMESVRSISRDLESGELGTVGSFCKEVISLLEKIKAATQIDFTMKINNGEPVLSHYQYTNLRTILNELISNSIKHAGCHLIAIYVRVVERNVAINYSDDGQGMAQDLPANGIGIQNMQERVNLLNGEFRLYNAYPEGYSIAISIPLVSS
jgi:two-component sensor histidine kinase